MRVTIEPIPSSQAIIAKPVGWSSADISAGAYAGYIAAQAAGDGFRILAAASVLQPNTREVVTTAHSPLTTLTELAGKRSGSTEPIASAPC